MNALFQLLSEQDIPALLELMQEFYSSQRLHFDERAATIGIRKLLAEPPLGQISFIFLGAELAGYFVLTFCFSLELHGKFALLDELYVCEEFRRRKLGKAVIAFAETLCKQKGVKALHLEVGGENEAAHGLYRACGFAQESRHLFTKWL
jgi:GNAT superfamily N-acetyltransferase